MPFGLVFGALYFGLLCVGVGVRLVMEPAAPVRSSGLCLAVLGASIAVGLVRRCGWARWAGCGSAVIVTLFALGLVAEEGSVTDFVLLLGSIATAVLLAVPATGRVAEPRRAAPALRWTAAASVVGLAATSLWLPAGEAARSTEPRARAALPAAARATQAAQIDWTDYGTGLERARTLGRPMVVTFVTDWCPYCTKMNRETWRSPAVVERLEGLVPVRVDAEETRQRSGHAGAELAERFSVTGFPANFVVGANGAVISRQDGYLSARQLLAWLDRAVGPAPGTRSASGSPGK